MGKMDQEEGYVFSLDLLLALIPLTILLGMAVADMDAMFYLTQEGVYQSSLQRVGRDTASALLETSGTPTNWEISGNPITVGLAKYSDRLNAPIENDISPTKLAALNTTLMQDLVGPEYAYFINITTVQTNAPYYSLGEYNSSVQNIARIERLVQLAKFEIVSEGTTVRNPSPARDFTNPPNPFKTNIEYNRIFEHYVLIFKNGTVSASVEVNDYTVITQDEFAEDFTFKRVKIPDNRLRNGTGLQDNSVVLKSVSSQGRDYFNIYVIRVPRGYPEGQITERDAMPILGRFVLYIWVR